VFHRRVKFLHPAVAREKTCLPGTCKKRPHFCQNVEDFLQNKKKLREKPQAGSHYLSANMVLAWTKYL
jgi:hypothetical protein